MLKWLWLSAGVILIDQLSKYIASTSLELYKSVVVMPMFNWTLMHNTGAAFSFLHDAGGWQRWFFTIIAIVVSIVIVSWLRKLEQREKWQAAALALILGGAIGNVIERVHLGYVIDFIDIYYQQWHWPAFNIADSAIFIGVAMIIFDTLREFQRERKNNSET